MSKQEEVQELPLTEENLAKNNLTIETEFENEIVGVEMEIQSSSTAEVVEDVKTLAHLLSLLLSDKKDLERLGFTIPSQVKTVMQKLMEHDSYFDSVEKLMKEIVHDNKIDAKDVPKIMILLADLHTLLKTKKIEFNEALCGDVIKFLFELALKEKLIPVGEEDLELLRCLFDIVDTSVKLLQTDKVGKERKGIVHYISKYMSSCFNK